MTMREIPNILASVAEWNSATGAPDFGGPHFPTGATSDEKKRAFLRELRPKTEMPVVELARRTLS